MKLNARKTLMKALGSAGLRDFKTQEEMIVSKTLHQLMIDNDQGPKAKPRKARTPRELAESITN